MFTVIWTLRMKQHGDSVFVLHGSDLNLLQEAVPVSEFKPTCVLSVAGSSWDSIQFLLLSAAVCFAGPSGPSTCVRVSSNPPNSLGRIYVQISCSLPSGSLSSRIHFNFPDALPWASCRWDSALQKKRCKFINVTVAFPCFQCRSPLVPACFWNILSKFYNCSLSVGPRTLVFTATESWPFLLRVFED